MAGQVLGAKAVTCPLGKWRQSRSCTTRCERESGVQKYPCPPRCNIINSSILALPCVTHLGSVKATCHNDSRYSNQVNNPLSFCAACARDRWHITLIATRWEKGRGEGVGNGYLAHFQIFLSFNISILYHHRPVSQADVDMWPLVCALAQLCLESKLRGGLLTRTHAGQALLPFHRQTATIFLLFLIHFYNY